MHSNRGFRVVRSTDRPPEPRRPHGDRDREQRRLRRQGRRAMAVTGGTVFRAWPGRASPKGVRHGRQDEAVVSCGDVDGRLKFTNLEGLDGESDGLP